jgi:hypothetical protein
MRVGERALGGEGSYSAFTPSLSVAPAPRVASSPWIFGRKRDDFLWFLLPGLIFLVGDFFIKDVPGSRIFPIYFFVSYSLIGSGHIYATNWRTYLNPAELKRSTMYLWVPLLCFAAFFSWSYFSWTWLALLPAYSQLWHHTRQSYGIQKWYQKQNNKYRKTSDYFLYALCFLPMAVFHFRQPTSLQSFLLPKDLLLYPNEALEKFFLGAYLVCLAAWVCYEWKNRKEREWNRLSFLAVTFLLNGGCFILGRNEWEIMFPLVAYHGSCYLGLTSLALNRTRKKTFSMKKAVFFVLLLALCFGFYERAIEFKQGHFSLLWESVWAGVYVTPIMCHYVYDAFLWKKGHPESAQIYQGA